VVVDGAEVRYGVSGLDGPDLLLVHGSRAHHVWWHVMLPTLERRWRVIRLDLSGHGDSDHRERYSAAGWVAELMAVLSDAGSDGAVWVGHSMGGKLAVAAAASHPERVAGLVLLDTAIRPPHLYRSRQQRNAPATRLYSSREEALTRFRLVPSQPTPPAELFGPVARGSVRAVDGGWTWKHDQRGLPIIEDEYVDTCAAAIRVPMAYVYGQYSAMVEASMAEHVQRSVPASVTVTCIAGAHHHLVIDAPDRCAAAIDQLGDRLCAGHSASRPM